MAISYPLTLAGVATRVLEAGTGATALVFLHGVGARADRWAGNLPAFAEAGYRCCAVDLPGHGFAAKHGGLRFDPASQRAFLLALLDHVRQGGAERCVLVGTSYGGLLALDLAAAHPGRVHGLVLVACLGLAPVEATARQRMALGLRTQTRGEVRARLERLVADAGRVSDAWVEEEFRINSSPGAGAALEALACFIEDGQDGLGAVRLQGPLRALAGQLSTALLWGAQDRSVPVAVGRAAHAAAPCTAWIELPGAGHLPYVEQADAFNEAVLAFLANGPSIPLPSSSMPSGALP